jgi:hypothetical protein
MKVPTLKAMDSMTKGFERNHVKELRGKCVYSNEPPILPSASYLDLLPLELRSEINDFVAAAEEKIRDCERWVAAGWEGKLTNKPVSSPNPSLCNAIRECVRSDSFSDATVRNKAREIERKCREKYGSSQISKWGWRIRSGWIRPNWNTVRFGILLQV